MQPSDGTDLGARLRVRARQIPAVMTALMRAVRWAPIVLSTGIGIVVVTFMKQSSEGYDMLTATRLSIVFIAAGAAMILDDPAATLTAASPSPLSFRRETRLAFGGGVIACMWVIAVAFISGAPRALWGGTIDGAPFPVVRFTVELGALVLLTLTTATVAGRMIGEDRGGLAGAPGLLAALVLLSQMPSRWAMLTAPGGERWADSGRDWTLAACVLLAALILLSADPARRGPYRWVRAQLNGRSAGH